MWNEGSGYTRFKESAPTEADILVTFEQRQHGCRNCTGKVKDSAFLYPDKGIKILCNIIIIVIVTLLKFFNLLKISYYSLFKLFFSNI